MCVNPAFKEMINQYKHFNVRSQFKLAINRSCQQTLGEEDKLYLLLKGLVLFIYFFATLAKGLKKKSQNILLSTIPVPSLCPRFLIFFLNFYAAAAKLLQSCPTLCNPIDGSPPGSPVPGILQARTLEWVAISFSNARK